MEVLQDNNQVVNKEILYLDYPLTKTSISGVEEESLESCIKVILDTNPNVVFNTIQYSKENHRIYFYTDSRISIKEWEKLTTPKKTKNSLLTATDILEEIKSILTYQENNQNTCMSISDNPNIISFYDVNNLLREKYSEYKQMEKKYSLEAANKLRNINSHITFRLKDFDYSNNTLKIVIDDSYFHYNDDKEINLYKKDDDLCIGQNSCYGVSDYLKHIGDIMSKLYDELLNFKDYKKTSAIIHPINSNFYISMDNYGYHISNKGYEFSLGRYFFSKDYTCRSDSLQVINAIKENEEMICKKLFVRISDCPEWMHKELYERKRHQIEERERITREKQAEEEKLSQKSNFKQKVLSILKKDKK